MIDNALLRRSIIERTGCPENVLDYLDEECEKLAFAGMCSWDECQDGVSILIRCKERSLAFEMWDKPESLIRIGGTETIYSGPLTMASAQNVMMLLRIMEAE